MKNKIETYKAQIDRIWEKVMVLANTDHVFWQVNAIIEANPAINTNNVFQEWIAHCYLRAILIDLRAIVDSRSGTFSLVQFLRSLAKDSQTTLTRRWFVTTHYHERMQDKGNETFDELFGVGTPFVPKIVILKDIEALRASLKSVVDYTNSHIAHESSRPTRAIPTYQEIRKAIVEVFNVLDKYWLLVKGGSMANVVPYYQSNWLSVFGIPWVPSGQSAPTFKTLDNLRDHNKTT